MNLENVNPGQKILVSACLLGNSCRYDGATKKHAALISLSQSHCFLPFCPEDVIFGTPRLPCKIQSGDGHDVLAGRTMVVNQSGTNVTDGFIAAAQKTLQEAVHQQVALAILKERSPSCGVSLIYNLKSPQPLPGCGVTTALLKQNNIPLISEEMI